MKKLLFIFFILFLNSIFAKQECLQYGVIPYVSAQKIEQSYSNWKSFLEKKINRCIDINIQSNYADIINMFANDKLDFAFVGPFSYILTKQHSKVEPIVTGVTSDGYATYKSLLLVTKKVAETLKIKEPLKSEKGMNLLKQKLQDHKKKWSIAFTDEGSTSGYAVPSYYMKKTKLDFKKYFKKRAFVGTHDAAQLVVAHNIIPFAFSAQMIYNQMIKNNKISKSKNIVIWESEDIPKSPIIVKENLPAKLKVKLQKALVQIPKEYFPQLGKTIAYRKTDSSNYKIIENIHKYLKR